MSLRRKAPPPEPAPGRLTRFSPSDWPAESLAEALAGWRAARRVWAEDSPGSLGDGVDMILAEGDARRRAYGIRAPMRG